MPKPAFPALLDALQRHPADPVALRQQLDMLLAHDQLDRALSWVNQDQPPAVFTALHEVAMERVSVTVDPVEGHLRGGMLVAFPLVFSERQPLVLDANFWTRLSAFARMKMGNPTVTLTPLADPVHPSTLPGVRLGAWHGMLRDRVRGLASSESLDFFLALEADKQRTHRPIASQSDQVVALTQRMQLAVLTYAPEVNLEVPIHRLANAALADPAAWAEVTGPRPPYTGMGVPQPIRPAFALAMRQHLGLALMVARQHRGLPFDGPLTWDRIHQDAFNVTFVPRSGTTMLDPITLPHGWLNVVGSAEVAEILEELVQDEPEAPAPTRPLSGRRRLN